MTLSLKTDDVPDHLKDKSLIISVDKNGNRYAIGGEYSLGWVTALANEFGSYVIAIDTIAPVITPLTMTEKKKLNSEKQIQFKISDNLSGIKSFRGEIDGQWVLFEFYPKTKTISYTFDKKRMEFGKNHHLSLVVIDNKGNKSAYNTTFYK
jgi:flagellar hook protein FlgE